MKIGETRKGQAKLADQDRKAIDRLSDELRSFHWEVESCGRDGSDHLEKARELARDVIKRLVNYI